MTTPTGTPFQKPSPDWDMVTVAWAGTYLDGTAATGSLRLKYDGGSPMLDDDLDLPLSIFGREVSVPIADTTVMIDGQPRKVGYVAVQIPASNDPDITGGGATYTFSEKLTAGGGRTNVTFVADKDVPGGVIWLNKIAGMKPSPGEPLPVWSYSDFAELVDRVEVLEDGGGGGTALTSYGQVSGLPDYPTTFPADLSGLAPVATTGSYNDLTDKPAAAGGPEWGTITGTLGAQTDLSNELAGKADVGHDHDGTYQPAGDYATGSQGALADTAVQPGDLADVATTGAYGDLTGTPTIPAEYDDTALSGRVAALENAGYITAGDLPAAPTWDTLSGKPAVIAAGTSATAARDAIGAGTSSLQLGTGSTTAAAGDHTHSQYATTTALTSHTGATSNPHAVTKAQVGLGSVDDVSAADLRDRSTHTGTQEQSTVTNLTADLGNKVDKVTGASLVYKLQESSTPAGVGLPAGSLYMTVPDGTPGAL